MLHRWNCPKCPLSETGKRPVVPQRRKLQIATVGALSVDLSLAELTRYEVLSSVSLGIYIYIWVSLGISWRVGLFVSFCIFVYLCVSLQASSRGGAAQTHVPVSRLLNSGPFSASDWDFWIVPTYSIKVHGRLFPKQFRSSQKSRAQTPAERARAPVRRSKVWKKKTL